MRCVVNLGIDGVDAVPAGETKFNIGVGTTMGFGDVGFIYNRKGDIHLNLRRAQSLLCFENMVVGIKMVGEVTADDGTVADGYMTLDADFYRMSGGDNANALFAMGIGYSAMGDGSLNLNYTWALESTIEWATLRLGYTQGYDLMNSAGDAGALRAGLGFMYGNWAADVVLSYDDPETIEEEPSTLDGIMTNPIHYIHGRNDTALAGAFSLSYAW